MSYTSLKTNNHFKQSNRTILVWSQVMFPNNNELEEQNRVHVQTLIQVKTISASNKSVQPGENLITWLTAGILFFQMTTTIILFIYLSLNPHVLLQDSCSTQFHHNPTCVLQTKPKHVYSVYT